MLDQPDCERPSMHVNDFKMYDHLDQPVFVLTGDENDRPIYSYLNVFARNKLGKTLDQIVGLPANRIFSGRAADAVYERQCAAWATGKTAQYDSAIHVGDTPSWVTASLKPVRDADGVMTHMVGVVTDVTSMHDQLQEHALATAAAHEVENLICLAAHDLRSPIGNLKSLAVLMRKDFIDHGDGKAELIDLVDVISDKALSVVADIMGQAMGVNTPTAHQKFDLGLACDDIMVLLDPARTRDVTFPRRWIEADNIVVHVILRNLIDNALKHAGVAKPTVVVQVEQMNPERLKFIVRDNGKGFAPVAEEDGAGEVTQPSGFGLVGVQRLARARGGVITVRPSTAGQGAVVEAELPGRFIDPVR